MQNPAPQHPQYIETLTLVRALKRVSFKLRSGRGCRQAEAIASWIEAELQRRASAAERLEGLSAPLCGA